MARGRRRLLVYPRVKSAQQADWSPNSENVHRRGTVAGSRDL